MVLWIKSNILDRSRIRGRFINGAFWSIVGSVISQGSSLAASIFSARILGNAIYGEMGIVISTIQTLALFASLGLGITVTKYVAEFCKKDIYRTGRIIGFSLIVVYVSSTLLAVALYVLGPYIAMHVLNAPHLSVALRWSSFLLWLTVVNGVQISILIGFESFKENAKINLFRAILYFPLTMAGIWLYGLLGGIWGQTLVLIIILIITQISINRVYKDFGIRVIYIDMLSELKILWKFALPVYLSGIIVGPIMWLGNTLLINKPGGYSEMGIFNAANQFRLLLIFLPAILGQAILPMLSSLIGENSIRDARKLLLVTVGSVAIVTLPISLLIIFAGNLIMSLFGASFNGRGDVLIIITLSAALLAIQTPVGQVLFASGRAWLGTAMNIGWASLFIFFSWYFINQQLGAKGLALGYLWAYAIHCIWTFAFAIFFLKPNKDLNVQLVLEAK